MSYPQAGEHAADRLRTRGESRPRSLTRAGLWLGSALAAAAAWVTFPAPDVSGPSADLIRLLQTMALIKGALVALALGVLDWRLRRPTPAAAAVGYLASAWSMSLMVVCMWRLAHLGLVALAFHAVVVLLVVVAWRDSEFIPRPPTLFDPTSRRKARAWTRT